MSSTEFIGQILIGPVLAAKRKRGGEGESFLNVKIPSSTFVNVSKSSFDKPSVIDETSF